ncbi:MAG TPA: RIP metalloprotease RseP [Paenalcaligenes sp.]|nr:RIP metalloprotease RseP [Paenalcaligenes sp.]
MLLTLIAFAFAIGLLVVIHELGHYVVARYCGVHIERFSFGFGKVLAQYTDRRGCQWAFSAIPLGGYVMMRNEVPATASAACQNSTLQSKTVWQRIAITAAGPVANLLLAAVLYAIMAWMGTVEPTAVLGQPAAGSAAAQAGFQAQEKITHVDSKAVSTWPQFRWAMLDAVYASDEVRIGVEGRDGRSGTRILIEPRHYFEQGADSDPLIALGFQMYLPQPSIQQVLPDTAAERAGLLEGDQIIALDGETIANAPDFIEWVKAHPNETVEITVLRHGREQSMPITIDEHREGGQTYGRVGAMIGANIDTQTIHEGFFAGLGTGVTRTAETFWFSLKMLGRMVTGQVSMKNISGPVTIADYAGQTARIGLSAYVQFLALISVSIGLLNLLPIPMLDGGHLLYYAIEVVRGRPLEEKWQAFGQRIGLAILAALMAFAFLNDFSRILQ